MELSDRQAQIAGILFQQGALSVDELAARYQVTTQTIRRDLAILCDQGLARRRHGGIEMPSAGGNLAYQSRQILLRREKQAIAAELATHIPDGASLAFSIGTPPEVVASALLRHDKLRIFTNNLNIAMAACSNESFEVHVAGGRLRNGDRDVLGPGNDAFFSSYLFDFGIYGVGGVDADGTLLDFSEEEVRARTLIQQNSRTTMLVVDHSKFGRNAHVRGGKISDASRVFCDAEPPAEILRILNQSDTELHICSGDSAI